MDAPAKVTALVDMGFPETHAKIAVERLKTGTTEQLVDYLIANSELIDRFLAQRSQPSAPPTALQPPAAVPVNLPPAPAVPRAPLQIGGNVIDPNSLPAAPLVPNVSMSRGAVAPPPSGNPNARPMPVGPAAVPVTQVAPGVGAVPPLAAASGTPPFRPSIAMSRSLAVSRAPLPSNAPFPSPPQSPGAASGQMAPPFAPPPNNPEWAATQAAQQTGAQQPPQSLAQAWGLPQQPASGSFNPALNLPGTPFPLTPRRADEPDYFRIPASARSKNPNNPIVMKQAGNATPNAQGGPTMRTSADMITGGEQPNLNQSADIPTSPQFPSPPSGPAMPASIPNGRPMAGTNAQMPATAPKPMTAAPPASRPTVSQGPDAELFSKDYWKANYSRNDAETFLNQSEAGAFVIRPSSQSGAFAISFKNQDNSIVHSLILKEKNGYKNPNDFFGTIHPNIDALLASFNLKKKVANPSVKKETVQQLIQAFPDRPKDDIEAALEQVKGNVNEAMDLLLSDQFNKVTEDRRWVQFTDYVRENWNWDKLVGQMKKAMSDKKITGADIVDWFLDNTRTRTRLQGEELGQQLLSAGWIAPAKPSPRFTDSDQFVCAFRLGSINSEQQRPKISVEDFEKVKLLGSGASGAVWLVKEQGTNELLALKEITKKFLSGKPQDFNGLLSEKEILVTCTDCPFTCNLHYAFQSKSAFYLVLELLDGKTLWEHLQKNGKLPKKMVKYLAAEMIVAIDYLHSKDIVYRDLKPHNILFGDDGHMVLSDFNLATYGTTERPYGIAGSPVYMAPEVFSGFYGKAVDWWSLGVVLYEAFTGRVPFDAPTMKELQTAVQTKPIPWPEMIVQEKKLHSFLQLLMERDKAKRVDNIPKIRKDPFLKDIDWVQLGHKKLPAPLSLLKS